LPLNVNDEKSAFWRFFLMLLLLMLLLLMLHTFILIIDISRLLSRRLQA